MMVRVRCADKYQAQKLAGLIYGYDTKETLVASILNVIRSETVISVRDGSAHSILFHDSDNAEMFADFIQSVMDNVDRIAAIKVLDTAVEMSKEPN